MEKSNIKLEFDKPGGKRLSNESNNYHLSLEGDNKIHGTSVEKKNTDSMDSSTYLKSTDKENPIDSNGSHNVMDDNELGLTNTNLDKNIYINDLDLVKRTKSGDRLSGKDNTIPKGDKYDDLK